MGISITNNIIMETQEIQHADILDILFEGRNKDYGAYQLRKTYNGRLTKAMTVTASICLLLIGGYTLAGRGGKTKVAQLNISDTLTLADYHKDEPVVIPPPIQAPAPPVAQIKNTIPKVVPNDQVKPDDVPPPVEDLDNAKIGTANIKGSDDVGITGPPTSGTGAGTVIEAPKRNEDDEDRIFNKVEIESTYPDGMQAWLRFVSKNYRVPDEAINNNVSGTIVVQFIVDKQGNVSDVQAVSGPEELRAEAVRVIKKSGKWTAAIQNGRPVNSYKRQPIVVRLENE